MRAFILTHGGAHAAMLRHVPGWSRAFEGFRYISPEDDPYGSLLIGKSCRNGAGSILRMEAAALMASRFPMACIMEYDTVFVAGALPDEGWEPNTVICSSIFENHDPQFQAAIYGHSPWIASGETWEKILRASDDDQGGWPDRWLALACQKAGIRLLGMKAGYSYDGEWTPEIIEEALSEKRAVYHGVKTEEAFNRIAAAHQSC